MDFVVLGVTKSRTRLSDFHTTTVSDMNLHPLAIFSGGRRAYLLRERQHSSWLNTIETAVVCAEGPT